MSIEDKIKTAKEDSWLKDSVSEKEFNHIQKSVRKITLDEAIKNAEEKAEEHRHLAERLKKLKDFVNYCNKRDEEYKQLAEWLKELKQLREQTRWIPCSERLPEEENKRYWICTDYGYQCECRWTNVNHIWTNLTTDWHWNIMDVPQYSKVVAWMPLPEPYKAESEG